MTSRQRRLHVVALPHTTLTERHATCAYSMKHMRFTGMMLDQGCEVFSYGPDFHDNRATEHVVITTKKDRKRWGFGERFNTANTPFAWDSSLPYWKEANARAVAGLMERCEERDYLCLLTGTQWPIADAVSGPDRIRGPISCEYGVGYEGICTPFCAFESYSWMNHVYGIQKMRHGRAFDAVIPNFFDKDQFYVTEKPDDYLLYMGRVISSKGVDIAQLIAERAGRRLVIAGPGARKWSKGSVVLHEGEELRGDLEYVGEVGFSERADLMSQAAALLAPTKYVEPFGGVAVEAMLSGTPVIASDWGAFPELLAPHTGRTIRTPLEGARAVDELAALDRQMIRDYAISRFSTDAVGPMFMSWFDRLDTLWGAGFYE